MLPADGGFLNLPARIVKSIKRIFAVSIPDGDKREFAVSIHRINIIRSKITTMTFIFLEVMMLVLHYIMHREELFDPPYIYYGSMYALNLAVMIAFSAVFMRLGADVQKNVYRIRRAGIFFISFILLWCGGISLLDQFSSGQVIVYAVAVISIAITPIFEPLIIFLVYFAVHLLFLIALPYFQASPRLVFGNAVNSTTFVIMSWAISCMRYKSQAEDFNSKKLILRKNDELETINARLQEANKQLEILSRTDGLTGVINRMSFETIIREEWNRCKRHSIPLSLIMLDIDSFKGYNDSYGHQIGDCCIKLVADVLKAGAKRSSDRVVRYGGDEFVILLPHTDNESALNFAEQIRKGVEEMPLPRSCSDAPERLTVSLGINTVIPSDETSIDEFIRNTDKALYIAKEKRNCSVSAGRMYT